MNVAWLSVETTAMELQGNILNWTYSGNHTRFLKIPQSPSRRQYGHGHMVLNLIMPLFLEKDLQRL